jgi:perosamine synthetase
MDLANQKIDGLKKSTTDDTTVMVANLNESQNDQLFCLCDGCGDDGDKISQYAVSSVVSQCKGLTNTRERVNFSLIDDACHALGAEVAGQRIGSWGDAAAFGFYPNKQITTGEGGCITTNAEDLASLARSLRNQGRNIDHRMEHVRLGYNYRLDELSAALGYAQLERLPALLRQRALVAAWYHEALAPLQDDICLPASMEHTTRSWFVYVIRLQDHYAPHARDLLMRRLQNQGIECAPYFPSIHLQPYYRERFGFKPGDFPVCEAVSARTLAIPFHGLLTQEEVSCVAEALKESMVDLPTIDATVSFKV